MKWKYETDREWKVGYKVCWIHTLPDDGGIELQSATSCGRILSYNIDAIRTPYSWDGPIAVFADIDAALMFYLKIDTENCAVFACRYRPSEYTALWVHSFAPRRSLPYGTRLADAVIVEARPIAIAGGGNDA